MNAENIMTPANQGRKFDLSKLSHLLSNPVSAVLILAAFVVVAVLGVLIAQRQSLLSGPVAPNAPESRPEAAGSALNICQMKFVVGTSPSPSPSTSPSPSATPNAGSSTFQGWVYCKDDNKPISGVEVEIRIPGQSRLDRDTTSGNYPSYTLTAPINSTDKYRIRISNEGNNVQSSWNGPFVETNFRSQYCANTSNSQYEQCSFSANNNYGQANFYYENCGQTSSPSPSPSISPSPSPCANCDFQFDAYWGPVIKNFYQNGKRFRYSSAGPGSASRLFGSRSSDTGSNDPNNYPACNLTGNRPNNDPGVDEVAYPCSDSGNPTSFVSVNWDISKIDISKDGVARATFKNNSSVCAVPIGLAAYKSNDTLGSQEAIIDAQEFIDDTTYLLQPGQQVTLSVSAAFLSNDFGQCVDEPSPPPAASPSPSPSASPSPSVSPSPSASPSSTEIVCKEKRFENSSRKYQQEGELRIYLNKSPRSANASQSVEVVDSLPSGLSFVRWVEPSNGNANGVSCSQSSGSIRCVFDKDSSTERVRFIYKVEDSANNPISNTAQVDYRGNTSSCSDELAITSTPSPSPSSTPKASNTPEPTPTPPVGPRCAGVTLYSSSNPIVIGSVVNLTCDRVSGVTNYEFRIVEPNGNLVSLQPVSSGARRSQDYQIQQEGKHYGQCRVCPDGSCEAWENY